MNKLIAQSTTTGIDFNKIQQGLGDKFNSNFPLSNTPGSSLGTVSKLINIVIPYLFVAAGLVLLFTLISSGLKMMTSSGDEKGLGEAKQRITNALIGFILLFASYWIVQIAEVILGISIL